MVQSRGRSLHGGGPGESGRSRGFQLWLALPPEQELGPVETVYLAPHAVARDGPARVLVGTHGTGHEFAQSPSVAELSGRALASWRVLALSTGRRPYSWLGRAEHGSPSCP